MEKYEGYMFTALCSSNLLLSCLLFSAVTREQREPYMDEVFHVPQAQRYCAGRFWEWDPMITTLPGLYLASVGLIRPAVWLADLTGGVVCSTAMLRFVNLLFNAGTLYLLYLLLCKLHPHHHDKDKIATASASARRVLSALALSAFPVLYFFNFLYYTDAGSTFFVLFAYLMTSYGCHKASALLSGVAVLFRQTNVVWAGFCAATLLAARMDAAWREEHAKKRDDDSSSSSSYQVPLSVGGARRVLRFALSFLTSGARVGAFLAEAWPYAAVGAAFAAFVLLNDGIVVGDRTKHQAAFHAPQLLYFLSFALFFSAPATLCHRRFLRFLRALRARPVPFLSAGALLALAVWRFTYEHEYLLADNRHYTFYVWSRVFRRHALARYALVPLYVYAAWHFLDVLSRRSLFWVLAFVACVAAATVPQRLLEFRYFIVPYLVYRVHTPVAALPRVLLEVALYAAVNAFTIYVFLNRTFRWPHDEEGATQRFMW